MRKVTMSILGLVGLAAIASLAGASGTRVVNDPSINVLEPSNQEVIYRSVGGCNDCWASGITLREAGNADGLAGGTIAVPPQVASNVVFAQIFWVTLDNVFPPTGSITVNGNAVTAIPIGPVTGSPCWVPANAYAFRADVSGFLVPGVNSLTGFPDSGNRNVSPSTEGVSLVIAFRSPTVDKEIIILAGNDDLGFFTQQVDLSIPVTSAAGFGAELTMIVADGQSNGSDGAPNATDAVAWNGTPISAPNAFLGLDSGPGVGFWDTEEFGVATGGANTVSLSIGSDCLNWVGTVLCVKRGGCVVPVAPSTWSKIKSLINN
ncbi:MAG: hypothetical protein SGI90_12315 [Candidatus Eisenbacteria bacterium]|nr:hypothetical protein [Candidatus Eisenbacteria bacterium]